MTALARYVPGVALSWPGEQAEQAVPLHRHVDGTLVFVDVSGFTALSERLAQHGKVGAEQLTDVLNGVFGTMLGLAAARGGTLLKFGGDALFLLFEGPEHPRQAASAAVEMRSALAQTSRTPGPAGRLSLRMSVGVHTGLVDLFLVGTSHRELVVAGPATTVVAEMEAAASAGQILLSPHTAATLPPSALGDVLGPGRLLRWRKAHVEMPEPHRRPEAVDPSRFVPTALRAALAVADPESEHRTVGVAFLRYTGLDALLDQQGHHAAAQALHVLVSEAQKAADEQGVTFLATDLAEDGGKVILVSGFPTTAEDDQGRLIRAACDVVDASCQDGFPLTVRAGINRGHVFAGAVGSPERATVTVMGDTVNLAARVMARADPDTVLATPSVLEAAQTLFDTEPVEPFMVKGKSRPVTAYLVGDETGTRPPRGLGVLPFLGREKELADVCDALIGVRLGRGGVLAVIGDAGIGKTRLVQEALTNEPGLATLSLRAEPYGAATPYRPLRDPLRHALGIGHVTPVELPEALHREVSSRAPDLLPWLPLIGDVLSIPVEATDATRDLDPKFRPERTAQAVVDLLAALSDLPLVVAFDDAHYSDDATAGVMARLERETATRPWLMLATLREGPGGYQPASGRSIPLGPLSDEATRALVLHGTAAAPLRPHEVDTVVARVAGNPLFLEETLRNLRDHGDLDALPSSLEGMVAAQIDALPPLARRLVRRASVLGRSFRVAVLADLFEHGELVLDDATRREMGEILESDGRDRLRFRHALLRDAAYDSLPYQQRKMLHGRAAQSTLRRAHGNPEAAADTLALHSYMAGDYASTWRWARVAGDQAREAYANPEAAAQYERALDAARRLRDVPVADVIDTWRSLGETRMTAGQFSESLEAYRQAFRVADTRERRATLKIWIGNLNERAGRYRVAHRELTSAERLVNEVADGARDPLLAKVLSSRALVLLAQERLEDAVRQGRRAVDAARSARDEDSLAQSLNLLGIAEAYLGLPDCADHFQEALTIFDRQGKLGWVAVVTANLGGRAWFEGQWDQARTLYERSAEAAARAGDVVQAASAQANLGELLVAQGDLDPATDVLTQSVRTFRAVGYIEGAVFAESQLGRAHAMRGDLDEARSIIGRLLDEISGTKPAAAVDLASALAEAEISAGDAQHGLLVLEQMLSEAGGNAGIYSAAAARVRARALTHLGRYAEAAAALAEAVQDAEQNGLGFERALLRLAEQELRCARGLLVDEREIAASRADLAALGVRASRIEALVAEVAAVSLS